MFGILDEFYSRSKCIISVAQSNIFFKVILVFKGHIYDKIIGNKIIIFGNKLIMAEFLCLIIFIKAN